MSYFVNTLLIFLLPFALSEERITIESSHQLATKYLSLNFELKCSGEEVLICRFNGRSPDFSPNRCCEVVLYDKEMNAISTPSPFRQYSSSINASHVRMHPGESIKFLCEVDTNKLIYSEHTAKYLTKPRYKDIYFYKLFYRGPFDRPPGAIGELQSPLFSLK